MIQDIIGSEIHEGDTIALATRIGNTAFLHIYKILSIGEEKEYGYIPVKARQIATGTHWANTQLSTLHGELFQEKALLVFLSVDIDVDVV